MIGIRADGNNQIGIGHIMRCMTIAEALQNMGEEVMFLIADRSCEELIKSRGFDVCILETAFDNMDSEFALLEDVLKRAKINCVLVDSYYATQEYLKNLRKKVFTVYLDDMDAYNYPVDVLINYNVFAEASDYPYGVKYTDGRQDMLQMKSGVPVVLAGPGYAPVRREFLHRQDIKKEEVKNILLSLGGSDAYNLSYKIAEKLLSATNACLKIVCGPFNLHKDTLYELAQKNNRVRVYENVKEMWKLMENCELAVSAAGSTMCELAVSGVPAVTFSFVENQRRIAMAFAQKQAAVSIGHYVPDEEEIFLEKAAAEVDKLCKNADKRIQLAGRAREMVDGRGAERIAGAILDVYSKKTNLR